MEDEHTESVWSKEIPVKEQLGIFKRLMHFVMRFKKRNAHCFNWSFSCQRY